MDPVNLGDAFVSLVGMVMSAPSRLAIQDVQLMECVPTGPVSAQMVSNCFRGSRQCH